MAPLRRLVSGRKQFVGFSNEPMLMKSSRVVRLSLDRPCIACSLIKKTSVWRLENGGAIDIRKASQFKPVKATGASYSSSEKLDRLALEAKFAL
jgi:hypothetical protein